jgi:hypothetical protein
MVQVQVTSPWPPRAVGSAIDTPQEKDMHTAQHVAEELFNLY